MEITWYGHSCFRVTERGMPTVVADPYDHAGVGFKPLKLKADIVTVSHDAPGHNFVSAVKGAQWELRGPGEYEIGGVFITAVPMRDGAQARNIVFVFDYDGLTVAHLGDMQKPPTQTQIEAIGNVDVLLVPVGGGNALSASKAAEVVAMIEPGVVVPMHYKVNGSTLKLNPVDPFLKDMGVADGKPESSLKIAKPNVPSETRVVVLEVGQ